MSPGMIGAFWAAGLLILICDLITKRAFPPPPPGIDHRDWLARHDWPAWIDPAWNTGVAWSMLADTPWVVVALTLVLIPLLVVFYWRSYRHTGIVNNIAFGAIVGGAVGNAWDRIWARFDPGMIGVRDWIHVDLGFWPLDPWPTFNIADSGICVGFALLLIASWLPPRETPPSAPND